MKTLQPPDDIPDNLFEPADIGYSTEMRWFFPDAPPPEIYQWFFGDESLLPKARTDRYLIFPACDSVGVKERKGKFEIKAICGLPCTLEFGANFSGNAQTWAKFSDNRPEILPFIDAMKRKNKGWLPVAKSRIARKFCITGDQADYEAGRADPSDQAIQAAQATQAILTVHDPLAPSPVGVKAKAEITEISVPGGLWWTFCIEVEGLMPEADGHLQMFGDMFLADGGFPGTLNAADSDSYPGWLSRRIS